MRTGLQQRLVPFFEELSPDIWLLIAGLLSDPEDQAALCVAHPRLGAVALRELSSFQGVYTGIALGLWSRPASQVFTEKLFRRYAASKKTDETRNPMAIEHAAAKLNDAAKAHSVQMSFVIHYSCIPKPGSVCWRLKTNQIVVGLMPCLRIDSPCGNVQHYQGDCGSEWLVRKDFANGKVRHYQPAD